MKWSTCGNRAQARVFLGVTTLDRIWVHSFSIVTAHHFNFQRNNVGFLSGLGQEQAMVTIKQPLTKAPALLTPRFGLEGWQLTLAVNAGGGG